MDQQKTTFILYYFLEHDASFHARYKSQLDKLKQEVIMPVEAVWMKTFEDADEKQEDGDLQTDGIPLSTPAFRTHESVELDDLCRAIGSQLAQIGDELDSKMQPNLIADFIRKMHAQLPDKDQLDLVTSVVHTVFQDRTSEIQPEEYLAVCTMLLVKKVALRAPDLLQKTFRVAVQFINQHNLVRVNDRGNV
ncbi:BH3-interacting domain death agonist-like [Protopterus annectens]|uniref:BH3-interacting domain death agonist-like n=1 Tax=Protopterus annectens TaxID=7888 RepID=UPI001CFBB4B7|nr:BH3-interacting domain death agonist-like [Protopterus annectens]XP_043943530.1 BH3-interacting domain death agonist-like [Protopterus annectens]XP_043943531.1 BH3-interacting domain death agonist-like [Protopterus annectens]